MRYVLDIDGDTCSKCPMLSYDSRTCMLGMGGPHHKMAIRMLGHPEWLFGRRPDWCPLTPLDDVAAGLPLDKDGTPIRPGMKVHLAHNDREVTVQSMVLTDDGTWLVYPKEGGGWQMPQSSGNVRVIPPMSFERLV